MTYLQAIEKFKDSLQQTFKLKAVFFDMDGVLFDSMPLHEKAWKQTFIEEGIILTREEPYMHEGSPATITSKNIIKQYTGIEITDEKAAQLKSRKHQLMAEYDPAMVMPGMQHLMNELHSNNIDCWVVTGSGQSLLTGRLEAEYNGILQMHKMVTAHDVIVGKPTPEPYLKAMEKSGYGIHETIVVENAPLGVLSAKAAGLFTLGINSGPIDPKHLWDAGADVVFDSSSDLVNSLPEFWEALVG